jgi:hypothetical protein
VTRPPRSYSAGAILGRFARAIGIVLIFCVVGPLAIAGLVALIVTTLGTSLLSVILDVVGLGTLRPIVSVAVWLLALASILAALPPAAAAGSIFAVAAIYADINKLWVAWVAAAIAVAGFVSFGIFFTPAESSAVILPGVRSAFQVLALSAALAVLVVLPVSLCWWLAKPLHRASVTA